MEVSQAFLDSIQSIRLNSFNEALKVGGYSGWCVRRLKFPDGEHLSVPGSKFRYEYLTKEGWRLWDLVSDFHSPHPIRFDSLFDIPAEYRDW